MYMSMIGLLTHYFSYIQLFQTEMYGRQQILHAIVKEGQQMVSEGDVEDQVKFIHQFILPVILNITLGFESS